MCPQALTKHMVFSRLPDMLALVWAMLMTSLLLGFFHSNGFDDPYITYRYAVNIAEGTGFVYNAGERLLSTTTPLYALMLAVPHWVGLDVPLVSTIIGCVCLGLGGLIFWRIGHVWQTPLIGVVGLVLYPTFPLLINTLGSETIVYTTLILAGMLACVQAHYDRTAVLFAVATLIRADAVLAVGVAVLYVCFTASRQDAKEIKKEHARDIQHTNAKALYVGLLKAFVVYVAILLPWFAFAWLYFGAPFPVTLAAKQQQGIMLISDSFQKGFVMMAKQYWHNPFRQVQMVLAGVGVLALFTYQRHWVLIVGWNVVYFIAYSMLGVTRYFWYYGPLVAGFVALVALGAETLYRLLKHVGGQRIAYATVAVLVPVVLVPHIQGWSFLHNHRDSRMVIYRDVGVWLHNHTPPNARVGTLEVGIIGYYAQRPMVDFAGLIQPETAWQITPTTTYGDLARWSFMRFHPDYLVLQDGALPELEQEASFQRACQPVKTFVRAEYASRLVVYACDGATSS